MIQKDSLRGLSQRHSHVPTSRDRVTVPVDEPLFAKTMFRNVVLGLLSAFPRKYLKGECDGGKWEISSEWTVGSLDSSRKLTRISVRPLADRPTDHASFLWQGAKLHREPPSAAAGATTTTRRLRSKKFRFIPNITGGCRRQPVRQAKRRYIYKHEDYSSSSSSSSSALAASAKSG